ncbi:DUF4352 domain-containing protein [Enterococcus sp. DIV0187]|uniref:DUF4352 domain-containing protein n=1 Tax=Enterococcus sp. DIV0187 TaxID=2774644 RepID=UPI003F201C11
MNKKVVVSLATLTLLGISGCSYNQGPNGSDSSEPKLSSSTSEVKKSTSTTSTSERETTNSSKETDCNDAQKKIKETTEAEKMATLFENNEPIVHGNDQVSFTINAYQYIKLENVSRNFRTIFGDQMKEGGVLLVSTTYKNTSDKSVYTGPSFSMGVVGYDSAISRNESLLGEDLVSDLLDRENEIKPNEELSGYVALAIKPAAMEKISESGIAEFEFPGIYSKPDSFSKSDALVEPKKETIALSDEGNGSKTDSSKFYEDKVTKENMGTKTMLLEKELSKAETFEDVTVTAEGYQITSFEPNEEEASRFSKFDSGVVLVTVKLTMKNDGAEALNVDSTSATLKIGDKVKMMSENMLQLKDGAADVGKGNSATKYIVFALDKESYETLYKDQPYELDVNLYNTNFERITKLSDVLFELS